MTPYRSHAYRFVFAAAGLYNVAFGVWTIARPLSFFSRFDLAPPRYPAIWSCLGMVVGIYGLLYWYGAKRLDRAKPIIGVGLLGKVLGPLGWIATVYSGEWPIRTFTLIVLNDIIWWLPFAPFLLDGTRVGDRVRGSAPYVCAAMNAAAIVAMGLALAPGTELVASWDDRMRYIAQHPIIWRGGWSIWIAAAMSLVGFYAWWGAHVRSSWAFGALAAAATGMVFDLIAESLYIAWLPEHRAVAPLATMLTGGVANGLYTVAGVILTIATASLSGWLLGVTWCIWAAGFALTAATFAGSSIAIAASTAVLFGLFCPWVVVMARRLSS